MNAIDGRSRVLAALEESLCHDSDIVFALVFGSLITSDSGTESDIDVAVKFAEHCSSRERFRKRCFLSGDLQQIDAPFVDLSDIESLPLEVAHDAVNGEFLCGDDRAFR